MTGFSVWAGADEVMRVYDAPGPLISTALGRGRGPNHPFLSATALDGGQEHRLRELLLLSTSLDSFRARLIAAGFVVSDLPPE